MVTPFEFGLVANTLKDHRWFFIENVCQGTGFLPTIMPEASQELNFLYKDQAGIEPASESSAK